MKLSPLLPEFPALLADGQPAVRMVMLYEDGESGRRARRFAPTGDRRTRTRASR